MKRTRIWLGLGSFVLAQLGGGAAPAAASAEHAAAMPAGQAGTGGETGESGAEAEAGPLGDGDYATMLHLVLGHLDVGEELVGLGAWNDALPHFAHPSEELYPALAPELARRGADPFADDLELLLRRVKAQDKGPRFAEALARVRAKVGGAFSAIDPATRDGAPYAADVLARVLHTAAGEYQEAFADGQLVAVVEYQDGRGFYAEALKLLAAHEAALSAVDPAAFGKLQQAVAGLRRAWPTPLAPAAPEVTPEQLWGLVGQVELDAQRFR